VKVPSPPDVRRFRVADHHGSPYAPGNTVNDLGVRPRYMAGVHVFTYDGITGPVYLKNVAGPGQVSLGEAGATVLNIHLYSQPESRDDIMPGHIQKFNSLASYHHGGPGATRDLDLAQNPNLKTNKLPEALPGDVSALELLSLYELPGGQTLTKGEDPVECAQGWGT